LAPASVFLFASIVIFVGVAIVGMMASATNGWSPLNAPQRIVVLAAVATGAGALAISMTGQMAPGNTCVADPLSLLCAILLALLLTISSAFQPTQEVGFITNGLACIKTGLTDSLAAGFLLLLLLRRGAARSPSVFGATAGGLGGLSGLSVLELTCSNVDLFHVLAWHCSEVLICASAGALLCVAVESYQCAKRGFHF
jgi:hypothetical protein